MSDNNALPFTTMAHRIIHNADASFGGAVVLVPPAGGKPIELLMIDAQGDEGQFWSTILTRIQLAMAEQEAKKRQHAGFGRQ